MIAFKYIHMENTRKLIRLLFINTICLAFLIINIKLLFIDVIWDFFVLLFLFISNLTELIKTFKNNKYYENNNNKKNGID